MTKPYFATHTLSHSYERLIHYWSVIFDRRNSLSVLDNVNFSASIFRHVLPMPRLIDYLNPELGYFSPDGSSEIGELVLQYERHYQQHQQKRMNWDSSRFGAGLGAGTSSVVAALLHSVVQLKRAAGAGPRINIIMCVPAYPVFFAAASKMDNVEIRLLQCRPPAFLPTVEEIKEVCDNATVALVVSSPTNPFQTYWTDQRELDRITGLCRARGVFFVLDAIYQNLCFAGRPADPLDDPHFVAKAYGPSKDTPFYSGLRAGYWVGDPALEQLYRKNISATLNALPCLSLLIFSIQLLLRMRKPSELTAKDFSFLNDGVLGWSRQVDSSQVFAWFKENGLDREFHAAAQAASSRQRADLGILHGGAKNFKHLNLISSPDCGNLAYVSVPGTKNKDVFEFLTNRFSLGAIAGDAFCIPDEFAGFRVTTVHRPAQETLERLLEIDRHLGL